MPEPESRKATSEPCVIQGCPGLAKFGFRLCSSPHHFHEQGCQSERNGDRACTCGLSENVVERITYGSPRRSEHLCVAHRGGLLAALDRVKMRRTREATDQPCDVEHPLEAVHAAAITKWEASLSTTSGRDSSDA